MSTITGANTSKGWIGKMDNSGLHHLANAATALTQLTEGQSKISVTECSRTNAVSDDDERSSQQIDIKSPKSIHYAHENSNSDGSKQIFPQRLMHMLNEKTISDIITWLPHGQSFVIIKPTLFTETILPVYFPESCTDKKSQKASSSSACKYPSFTRKLNRWGFRQISRGADAGAFHHKLFLRDIPEKCLQMVCQRSRRRKNEKKNVEESSDVGSVEIFISPRITTDLASHSNDSKRKLCEMRESLVTDSESDTSSTLTNEAKSLPPKKRKHCLGTQASEFVAQTVVCLTPPRPENTSAPTTPSMTTDNCPINPDSSVNHVGDTLKGTTSLTSHTAGPLLLHPPSETYLDASALVKHNLSFNSIQSLNAAVAMAHFQTQHIPFPLTLLDNIVGLGGNSTIQNYSNLTLQPTTKINLAQSHVGASSKGKHDNVRCSSEGDKGNEAQELAKNAKKMLYSAFLEALK